MRWTHEQYDEYLRKRQAQYAKACSEASAAEPQQCSGAASHGSGEIKARHPRKCLVRITSFRAKHLQDPDNAVVKWHIDALRRAGLLDDDTSEAIRLQIEPDVKVATVEEERTEIELQRIG